MDDKKRPPYRPSSRPHAPYHKSDRPTGERPPAWKSDKSEISSMIKKFSGLKNEKGRLKQSKFLIEGVKIISEIISTSPSIIDCILVTPTFSDPAFIALVKKHRIQLKPVNEREFDFISDTQSPQGVLAIGKFSSVKPDWALCRYITLLDGIQDPGNVGVLLRTSVAMGMDAVLLGKGTCDIYNPKVIRASAGMFLRIAFEANVDLLSKVTFLRQKGFTIVATSPRAHYTISQVKLRKKVALIVSNEGSGINDKLSTWADSIVRVPMKSDTESLNVAVAHGIISHELIHGRT